MPRDALAQKGQVPAWPRRAVEAEQQDPLPLAQAELAGGERDLLGARTEEHAELPLAVTQVLRNEPREQLLQVVEEPALAFLHPDERHVLDRRDVRAPVLVAGLAALPVPLVGALPP